jgi:hypothetical protein
MEITEGSCLANCIELNGLDVGGNNFMDSFPSWQGNLPHLRVLIRRSNQFYGPVTTVSMDPHSQKKNHSRSVYFSSLQIIDLAENGFTGALHSHKVPGTIGSWNGDRKTWNAP